MLASITSDEMNTKLYSMATTAAYFWIGLNDLEIEGNFKWADGDETTYENWHEPRGVRADDDCVYMSMKNGEWFNDDCNKHFYAVCERQSECSSSSESE
jgi:hypothetical protein